MSWFKHLIWEHKYAVIVAILVSLMVAAPQIAFRYEHRDDGVYQGIELLPDSPWSSRVREVMDGHPNFGSIYYTDGKGDPYLFQPGGSMTVAYMGEAFGLDINNTLLLARFVLTFIAFLLIYAFIVLLSRDKLAALAGTSVLLLADAVMNLSGVKNLVQGISPANFLSIGLPVDPAMFFIPLFAFLIAFWLFYTRRDWRWGIASAVLLGFSFYNYFYSWTYLYAFGGFLVLLFLLKKDWREAARVCSVFAGALLMAIPYGINIYRAAQYPTYAEVGERFGIVATHAPLFIGFVALGALMVFLLWFPRGDKQKYLFWLALLLAPIATLNQQILTGKEMQAAHYHWYFHKPIAVLLVIVLIFYLCGRLKTAWCRQALAILMVAGSFAIGVFIQADSYLNNRGNYGGTVAVEQQRYGPVMEWLNHNAAKEEVVLSNNPISYLVTIYTPLNVFYHRAALHSLSATRERLLDGTFTFYRLRGVGAADAQKVFFTERGSVSSSIYGIYYRQLSGSYEAIPDEALNNIVALYEATLATSTLEWLREKMTQYEVNYVVWDKKADPSWQLQKYSFLKEAAVLGDIVIYRFAP